MAPTATLYCIYGTIAAGKTTLARKLAAQHGAVLLCEDEWLVRLEAEIASFDDFRKHARRLRAAIGPHVVELLRLGTSVALDFAAPTPRSMRPLAAVGSPVVGSAVHNVA